MKYDDEQKLIMDYKDFKTIKELVIKYKTSAVTIYNILKKYKIDTKRIPGNKLSNELIRHILYDYYTGIRKQYEIAEFYKISEITVRKYLLQYKTEINTSGVKMVLDLHFGKSKEE